MTCALSGVLGALAVLPVGIWVKVENVNKYGTILIGLGIIPWFFACVGLFWLCVCAVEWLDHMDKERRKLKVVKQSWREHLAVSPEHQLEIEPHNSHNPHFTTQE
jgi:hypothetical protein